MSDECGKGQLISTLLPDRSCGSSSSRMAHVFSSTAIRHPSPISPHASRFLMPYYVIRRVLYALPIAFGVSLVVFSLIHLAPGDPLSAVIGEADAKLIAEMRAAFGYDKPLYVQYFIWLGNVVTGEFGYSLRSGQPVLNTLLPAA